MWQYPSLHSETPLSAIVTRGSRRLPPRQNRRGKAAKLGKPARPSGTKRRGPGGAGPRAPALPSVSGSLGAAERGPAPVNEARFQRVVEIMRRLRAPNGCPWDREQTFDSIRANTLEEAYEVLEAIGERDWEGLREELGDLLLQVVFYAEMAEEEGKFTIAGVLEELADKLVRRHPHVFGKEKAANADAALARWNAAKAAEGKREDRSALAGIPRALPGLAEAQKMGQRAARQGFDWDNVEGVWRKLDEELAELRTAETRETREEEMGDVLFTAANLARHMGVDPEAALKHANQKFARRYRAMEALAPDARGRTAQQWEELWQRAKRAEAQE
ncbi:MAG: nucleoside triphosphate pyrophosphohydrolase [Acidobacteria bacterium]|nr:MAG: nucleoside triphosphate pyrophosphohydrolase [Acidobacteriota bacterium]